MIQQAHSTPTSYPYDAGLLACVFCHAHLQQLTTGQLYCPHCQHQYNRRDGFIDLTPDPALSTRLVEHHYNAEHGIDDTRRMKLWHSWQNVLDKHDCQRGDVLEIGVGSGQLTWGLAHHSQFAAVHIADISSRFLRIAASTLGITPRPACYYLCDANRLPFRNESLDCIIGNSVLHHFADYAHTLAGTYAALKPGGTAIFYEPVQQGKAIVSLLLRLLRDTDSTVARPLFTPEQHQKLHHMSRHITHQLPAQSADTDIEALAKREDKYIFDIPSLEQLAIQTGFRALHAENNTGTDYSYWLNVLQQLEMAGFNREQVKQYRYLFTGVQETLGTMLRNTLTSPMVFLVFRK